MNKIIAAAATLSLILDMAAPAFAADSGQNGRNPHEGHIPSAGPAPFTWGHAFSSDTLTSFSSEHISLGSRFEAEPFDLDLFIDNSQATDWQTYQSNITQAASEADLAYKIEDLLLLGRYRFDNYKNASDMQPLAEQQNHRVTAYGKTKVGLIDLEAAWGWQFGDWKEFNRQEVRNAGIDAKSFKISGNTQIDRFTIGLTYLWFTVQGEAATNGNDLTAAMALARGGLWDDFNPYYLLTATSGGMLNTNDFSAYPGLAMHTINTFGIQADYQVSGQLTLHSALAYAWADHMARTAQGAVNKANAGYAGDDEYGWEVDLGAKYKLFDNLTYEVRAAYFNSGDFFEDLNQPNDAANKSNNLYLLSHHLTMSF